MKQTCTSLGTFWAFKRGVVWSLLAAGMATPLFAQNSYSDTPAPQSVKETPVEQVLPANPNLSPPMVFTVKGHVRDENKEPLAGVSVVVKGTTNGTLTDANGAYSLTVETGQETLVFSFIGYLIQERPINGQAQLDVSLASDTQALNEVVVVGYGTQKKSELTAAVASVSSKDIEQVAATTVSAALAGKLPGVTFRMDDGRPGASANIQVRNFGEALFVIDGIQKDGGQFNNIAPTDIESITVLKDAAASVYGARAANGVVIVTTKRGKAGKNTINIDTYYGIQNWSRFPQVGNAYDWQLGNLEALINSGVPVTDPRIVKPDDLEKWKQGTEKGYQSFDWYNFIVQKNAPQYNFRISTSGGSDRITYYLSATHVKQYSVLGREFTFTRTNVQGNVDAKVSTRLKVGMQLNGRIETRDQPGVPGSDDYWAPRFAIFRNTPMDRPFANDNPNYLNDIGHNETNWGLLNKAKSGYWKEDWRVLQLNFNGEYDLPLKGLKAKGMYSYYLADKLMNGHEYTYDAFTYRPATDTYDRTGGSTNPWRERGTTKIVEQVLQGYLIYNNTFGKHTVGATFVAERISRTTYDVWVHAVPSINTLPLLLFPNVDVYNDNEFEEARLGYVGRVTYNFQNKYFLELAGRRDASTLFRSDKRFGFFPSVSAGWQLSNEKFFENLMGTSAVISSLKIRASYGRLGDDRDLVSPFAYLQGYRYPQSQVILDGQTVISSRNRGVPQANVTWKTSQITDIGMDYGLWNNKITGSIDYFYRKLSGLPAAKNDVLLPKELGYNLPNENLNSNATLGGEFSVAYNGSIQGLTFTVGGNIGLARTKTTFDYNNRRFANSLNEYYAGNIGRWDATNWGFVAIGQFQSQEEINAHTVDIDGQKNASLRPGDIIYKDVNGDGVISGGDLVPIGYPEYQNPLLNYGLTFTANWKGFDLRADFSGGSMYSHTLDWELRVPFQNGGNLAKMFVDNRWHRQDPYNIDSPWVSGKYPSLRFNERDSNTDRPSTFWLINVRYLRARTIELGYSLPASLLSKLKLERIRVYVNTYNLFTLDNVSQYGIDPEIFDNNGLQYPQNRLVNLGLSITL